MIGLFLDVSTRTGWSLWQGPADPAPRFGTFKLRQGGEIGPRTLALRVWMRGMLALHRPQVIGFEAPLVIAPSMGGGGFTQAGTIRLQISLAAEIETCACEGAVPHILEAATMTCKKLLTGSAKLGDEWKGRPAADRSREWKRRMMAMATARGWEVADDHQADAGAVALVAYQSLGFDVA